MKYAVSYVAGTGGDFVVNCCNHVWTEKINETGRVTASASTKIQENNLNDSDWMQLVDQLPFSYVGTHQVDKLLRLPVNSIWLVVPDFNSYQIWARRDCVTRHYKKLLGKSGNFFNTIQELILSQQSKEAAELYLNWITEYNWVQMKMRLAQQANKIDTSYLLTPNGIDSIVDQLPQLNSVIDQCRQYHSFWLSCQHDLSEESTVRVLADKLYRFVKEVDHN